MIKVSDENFKHLDANSIIRVFRDGPKYDDKPRFLKVLCSNPQAKKDFIRFVNLKFKSEGLRARPDLSFLQRENARKLRMKFNAMTDKEKFYIDYRTNTIKVRNTFDSARTSVINT